MNLWCIWEIFIQVTTNNYRMCMLLFLKYNSYSWWPVSWFSKILSLLLLLEGRYAEIKRIFSPVPTMNSSHWSQCSYIRIMSLLWNSSRIAFADVFTFLQWKEIILSSFSHFRFPSCAIWGLLCSCAGTKKILVISIVYFHSLYHSWDFALGFADSKLFLALLGFGLLPPLLW